MDDGPRALWADPATRRVEAAGGTWLLSGNRPDALAGAVEASADAVDAIDRFAADDAVAVRLGDDAIDAYRSVTATRNVYLVTVPEGPVVVADSFRNALAELPVAHRTVPQPAVADHLLFRHPVEPDTYVSRIDALEHGSHLRYDATTGDRETRVVERLDPGTSTPVGRAASRIDGTLEAVLEETYPDGAVTNMLSGGVDSTLLHTYLDDAPGLVMTIDSPEFAHEEETADRAAAMLDVPTRRVAVEEADFLDALAASVDALGFPSHYNQTVLTDAAFRATDQSVYVNGEGADALFGLTGVKGARVAGALGPVLSAPGATALVKGGLGTVVPGAATVADVAEWLDRPVSDPESFAQRLPFFTDPGVVAAMTDEGTVAERFRRVTEYVRARVERPPRGRFLDHVEFGQLLAAFRHNTVDQWRQLGFVHGHELVAPFKTRRLASCALSIPGERRYIGGRGSFTPKHLLKSLLEGRLPAYPTRQRKGAGSLPVERYFADGPLAGVFERYDPPAFVPESLHADHVEQFGPVTWNLVTFAVWRDRVLENPDLSRVPGTRVVER